MELTCDFILMSSVMYEDESKESDHADTRKVSAQMHPHRTRGDEQSAQPKHNQ
jgi:hypothetical protein